MDTLVLSSSWEPIEHIGWERAITLLTLGRVEVVAEHEDRVVRSVSVTFKIPSIIRFLTGALRRRRGVRYSKESIHARDKGRCQYCNVAVSIKEMTQEHVVPRAQGGRTTWTNIVAACKRCNETKANRTPQQAGMKLLSKPERPKYLPEVLRFSGDVPESWTFYLGR